MEKQQILRELDETGLLAGALISRGLLANDRAKYAMTLLQLAFARARDPHADFDDLSDERAPLELEDRTLDEVIPGATLAEGGSYRIPGVRKVLELLFDSCREMFEPIALSLNSGGEALRERLDRLIADNAAVDESRLEEEWLENLTRGIRGRGDSVHLYVMDAHREILRIQQELAETQVDGVPCIGILEEDEPLVRAFITGVRSTKHLKLDHPGLGTAASRYGGRLVVQNDVGTTDSHVVVISVAKDRIEVTYTDVHARRLAFFKKLLEPLSPQWRESATRSSDKLKEGERYYVLRGSVDASTPEEQAATLKHVGSRLVFLIDWNKARKRLRVFLPNKSAVRVLEDAAGDETGHMAFLKWGGEELVYQALEVAAGDRLRYGEPLHVALGSGATEECMGQVLRICHEGMTNDESAQVVRDRVVAVFNRALTRKSPGVLLDCRRQAALVVEAALTLHQVMRVLRIHRDARPFLLRSQSRIERWENQADGILNHVRRKDGNRNSAIPVRELSGAIDDALDAIDRGMFFLARLGAQELQAAPVRRLHELTDILVRGAQEFYKAIATVSESSARRSDEDLPGFLESVGRLDELTKAKNGEEREYLEEIFDLPASAGQIQRWREIGLRISSSVEHLSRGAFLLYDSIFNPGQIGS